MKNDSKKLFIKLKKNSDKCCAEIKSELYRPMNKMHFLSINN